MTNLCIVWQSVTLFKLWSNQTCSWWLIFLSLGVPHALCLDIHRNLACWAVSCPWKFHCALCSPVICPLKLIADVHSRKSSTLSCNPFLEILHTIQCSVTWNLCILCCTQFFIACVPYWSTTHHSSDCTPPKPLAHLALDGSNWGNDLGVGSNQPISTIRSSGKDRLFLRIHSLVYSAMVCVDSL